MGVITQSLPQSWVSGGHYLGIDDAAQNIGVTGDGIKVFVSWGKCQSIMKKHRQNIYRSSTNVAKFYIIKSIIDQLERATLFVN